uniref:Uncharacterized protein n=1 Tax=Aegilops tauschii subsp. strangulata TaxID=200361 RepID=A0A453BJT8_AEGTS
CFSLSNYESGEMKGNGSVESRKAFITRAPHTASQPNAISPCPSLFLVDAQAPGKFSVGEKSRAVSRPQ